MTFDSLPARMEAQSNSEQIMNAFFGSQTHIEVWPTRSHIPPLVIGNVVKVSV